MSVFVLLIVGIFGLWLGTELTIKNAVRLARSFRVSELFIGLTILAFGSDLPELFVAIDGAIRTLQGTDTSGVVSGNAIGSSIAQISLVIGTAAIFHYLRIGKKQIRFLGIELIGSILLLTLVAFDRVITWDDGAILMVAFFIHFFYMIFNREKRPPEDTTREHNFLKIAGQVFLLFFGLFVVTYFSDYTVEKALHIAELWGVEQSFVGAILIGLGTSLPELAISMNAVLKKKASLSVGNIIGSNIFDLLVPLGVGSLIAPIQIDSYLLWFDLPVLLVLTGMVIFYLSRKQGLQKSEGIGLIVFYLGYAVAKYFMS